MGVLCVAALSKHPTDHLAQTADNGVWSGMQIHSLEQHTLHSTGNHVKQPHDSRGPGVSEMKFICEPGKPWD